MTTQTHELPYFPSPDVVLHDDGTRVESYRREDTTVLLRHLPPGTSLTERVGDGSVVGMVVRGELSVTVADATHTLLPEQDAYVAPPGVELSAVNTAAGETIVLEIRRDKAGESYPAPEGYFLKPIESRKFVGMDVTFFLADWIELMVADIPAGGEMPYHSHSHEQIGTCLEGRYEMTVEQSGHELRFGSTYFCASHEGHGAANPNDALARSLNIFIPPRYHRVPKREAS